ncbi:MAG TPA: EAL domain-containing protein [Acidisoma sp.]|uniref:EAL and HDOD domain-containing protein n=1 Tax=Acidisoma sp. TaxID=1872115 RepID=UPI002C025A85|nr:EAL domain-containing protein [Acidisoma sp.]HTH99719.1 EAL domain-containing protein [Acidisoma sp.]
MSDRAQAPTVPHRAAAACNTGADTFFLGRQPIVGRKRELFAYELLFRSGTHNAAGVVDDFVATATVINNAFLSLGIQGAIGDRRGFINVCEEALMSEVIELLPRDQIVLEILEDVELTPSLIERCRQLKEDGYFLALDDVVRLTKEQLSLFDCLAYLKIDITGMAEPTVRDFVALGHAHGLAVLAEKVETEAQFSFCHTLGIDFFQGYFFARPTILTGRAVRPSKILLVNLLRLLEADADIEALERALKEAPDLTVRLLRMANSCAMQQTRKVSSLRTAILLLGREQIGRLVQVMLFVGHVGVDISSDPLVQTAAIRGRLMEHLAEAHGLNALRGQAFMVGILSLADSVFGQSMIQLVKMLNLDDALADALLHRQGPLGRLLILVEASEQPDGVDLAAALAELSSASLAAFNRMQLDAMRWASSL